MKGLSLGYRLGRYLRKDGHIGESIRIVEDAIATSGKIL